MIVTIVVGQLVLGLHLRLLLWVEILHVHVQLLHLLLPRRPLRCALLSLSMVLHELRMAHLMARSI